MILEIAVTESGARALLEKDVASLSRDLSYKVLRIREDVAEPPQITVKELSHLLRPPEGVALSIILLLRNNETTVADMLHVAVMLGQSTAGAGNFEVLAIDTEGSLSTVLSVLQARVRWIRDGDVR